MGDDIQTDGLDLPLHEQSGNLDRGQISTMNQRELQEQASALNTVLEQYYTLQGGLNFNTVLGGLTDLGYTDERARAIRTDAQVERIIRTQNDGIPSNLSLNQLDFIAHNHGSQLIHGGFQVYSDERGQYISDNRVREVDGNPSRMYLPASVQFNPLTGEQQTTQEERLLQARPEFLNDFIEFNYPEPSEGRGSFTADDFTTSDRTTIDNLSVDYLKNPNQQSLTELRENIDMLVGPQGTGPGYVRNANEILNQYMVDIQYEANYRLNNNNIPQGMDEETYDFLLSHPDYNYDGGLIYTNQETGYQYYYDIHRGRRRSVPSFSDAGELNTQRRTIDDITLPPSLLLITSQEDFDSGTSVRFPRSSLDPQEQTRIQADMANAINGDIPFPDFLNTINTEYSLSNRQFIDVSRYVMDNSGGDISYADGNRIGLYTDEPIYVMRLNGRTVITDQETVFRSAFPGIDRSIVDSQVVNIQTTWDTLHFAVLQDGKLHPDVSPQDDVATQIAEGRLNPELLRIAPVTIPTTTYINPNTGTNAEEILNNIISTGGVGTLGIPPAVRPIFQEPINVGPPIVEGQTAPVNFETGENINVDELSQRVIRYEQYFNSQQSQHFEFRQTFRDLFSIFSGATGGFMAFSLQRSMEKGTYYTLIQQEKIFLDGIDIKIQTLKENLIEAQSDVKSKSVEFLSEESDLTRIELRTQSTGSQGSAPGTPPETPGGPVNPGLLLDKKFREVQRIEGELIEAERLTEDIEMDLASESADRTSVNIHLEKLMETNKKILLGINRYRREALVGFSIGHTLGLVISGYFFPTFVDIEDNNEFITADNVEYNPKKKDKQKKNKEPPVVAKSKLPFHIQKPGTIVAGEGNISKRQQPIISSFIPTKNNNNGRPLTYGEIQFYKSTLNKDELMRLKDKHLIFGENNSVIGKNDKCKNIIKDIQIKIIPI